jgi:hypothetical protein
VASRDPARPASASAIDTSALVSVGVRLANGEVRPGTCSLNVVWQHASLTHLKRRTVTTTFTPRPATGESANERR